MNIVESVKACIHLLPSLKIAYIGKRNDELLEMLNSLVIPVNGEIKAFIYDETPEEYSHVSVSMMEDYSKIFRTVAREYEMLIINKLSKDIVNQERLFKTAFKALENSGDFLLIEDELTGLQERLESVGFVAINEIETSQKEHLLSSKKMHGWGHGL